MLLYVYRWLARRLVINNVNCVMKMTSPARTIFHLILSMNIEYCSHDLELLTSTIEISKLPDTLISQHAAAKKTRLSLASKNYNWNYNCITETCKCRKLWHRVEVNVILSNHARIKSTMLTKIKWLWHLNVMLCMYSSNVCIRSSLLYYWTVSNPYWKKIPLWDKY